MGQSKRAGVGVMVLAIAVIGAVGVLIWRSQSDDTTRGAEGKRAQSEKQGERASRPGLEQDGDEAAENAETPPSAGGSLHDRLGGRDAIHAVTGKLLEAAQKNEVIMANEKLREVAKRVNVRELHHRVTDYVCREAGGPCKYTGRPMKEYIAQLELSSAEWDAIHKDLAAVLAELQVPEPEARELRAIFAGLQK